MTQGLSRASLLGVVLLLAAVGLSGPVSATHEGVAGPEEITVSPSGIKYLKELDLHDLRVCADCGYFVVDEPQYEPISQADRRWREDDLVLSLMVNGVTRAYPLQALQPPQFHIVNDIIGGVAVAVSFCPLCFSAVVFERPQINGQLADFATAGLYQRDLVMYDDVTFSLWQQFTGEPIAGSVVGELGLLHRLPADIVPYGDWKRANPEAFVYVRPDRRPRGTVPELRQYEEIALGTGRASGRTDDERLADRDIVVGIVVEGQPKAYLESAVLEVRLLNDVVGGEPVLVVVDSVSTEIRFFYRRVGGQELTFELRGSELYDRETGSRWSFFGATQEGPLAGQLLEQIPSMTAFWFAWITFYPDTELYRG